MNILKKGRQFFSDNPVLQKRFDSAIQKLASEGGTVNFSLDWRVDELNDLGVHRENPYGEEGNVQGKVTFNFPGTRIKFKAAFALKKKGRGWTILRDQSGEPVSVLFEKTSVSQAQFKEKIKRPVRDNDLSEALVSIIGKDRLAISSSGITAQASIHKLKEVGNRQMMLVTFGGSVWVVQFEMTSLWGQMSVNVMDIKVLPKSLSFTKDILVNLLNEVIK